LVPFPLDRVPPYEAPMPVVPIDADYSNVADFVNSLFDADVRTVEVVQAAIGAGDLTATFSDQGDKLLRVWLAAWQQAQGDPYDPADFDHCPAQDRSLVAFLSAYLRANALSMFLPEITYVGPSSDGLPIYQLGGYTRQDFVSGAAWQYGTVQAFLELLMLGAHFVVIQDPSDLPNGPSVSSLWADFKSADTLRDDERWDP